MIPVTGATERGFSNMVIVDSVDDPHRWRLDRHKHGSFDQAASQRHNTTRKPSVLCDAHHCLQLAQTR